MNHGNRIRQALQRAVKRLKGLYAGTRMPSAMVSWRLLLPGGDPFIRTHRAFWPHVRPNRSLAVNIVLESLAWVRWVLWYAWIDTFICMRHCAADAIADGGPGHLKQFASVLGLALLHTIHPSNAYTLALYRPEQRRRLWQYVYDHETAAYHHWRSSGLVSQAAATELLADKLALTRHLQQLGLPAAEILEVVLPGQMPDFKPWLAQHSALFCKTRRGARAEGAFSVESCEAEPGFTVRDYWRTGTEPRTGNVQLQTLLAKAEYLLQPRLENHPRLAALGDAGKPVELRVTTEYQPGGVFIHHAYLYLAVRDGEELGYLLFPVELATGTVGLPPTLANAPRLRSRAQAVQETLAGEHLPGWPEICEAVLKAHQGVLCGARTIAWDVLMTPDGPRILEGNNGWGVMPPQLLNVPLLSVR